MCVSEFQCGARSRASLRTFDHKTLLSGFCCALALGAIPAPVRAALSSTAPDRYLLFLERVDTGEYAAEPFTLDGKSLYWAGYKKLCAVLRDEHVAPEIGFVQINVRTIEALWSVQSFLRRAGIAAPIMVHSGYRTPQTNAQIEGAARLSYHMWGKAVDFHVPGVELGELAGICEACPISGGVGYYPDGWVHMDTGPKRTWVG
jgi:uncharacterized protein YcbK (DUF882 family)